MFVGRGFSSRRLGFGFCFSEKGVVHRVKVIARTSKKRVSLNLCWIPRYAVGHCMGG